MFCGGCTLNSGVGNRDFWQAAIAAFFGRSGIGGSPDRLPGFAELGLNY
jgi:hypothetical protein